jgi:hypothetical protein
VRYIRTEVPRITKLQAKIMAFQQYQVKLKQRLNELKGKHDVLLLYYYFLVI